MTVTLDKSPIQLYPDNLLTEETLPGQWRVAKTKSRREKALAQFLSEQGIGYYLPMVKKRQPGSKRERYSLMPVFSGYLFFKSSDLERYQAIKSNHIACVIDVKDETQLLRDLDQVHRAISLDTPVYPYDFIRTGEQVVIKSGPFKGVQGVVHRKGKNYRLVLNINCLCQSLALDIESHCVEPVGRIRLAKEGLSRTCSA